MDDGGGPDRVRREEVVAATLRADPKEAVLELVREKVAQASRAYTAAVEAGAVAASPGNLAFAGDARVGELRRSAFQADQEAWYWKKVEEYLMCRL